MLCLLVENACASFAIGGPSADVGVLAYDAPSLPPGMHKWQKFTQGEGPWYRWPNLQAYRLLSDAIGQPTPIKDSTTKQKYWWLPEGSTNLTMGPFFPAGTSTTKLVKAYVRPPSPGLIFEMDRPFDCAIYDEAKSNLCYERVPHESQVDTTVFDLGLGPTFQKRETSRCTLRWILNVLMNDDGQSGCSSLAMGGSFGEERIAKMWGTGAKRFHSRDFRHCSRAP